MDAVPDVRTRIIAAANELYARSGKFPSVAAVRQAARTDMNTTSAVMRDWRRERQHPPTTTTVPMPDAVVGQANAAISAIWNGAMELANEALRNAQAAWAQERAEAEHHLQQVVEAFDSQATELAGIRQALCDAERKLERATRVEQALRYRITGFEQQLAFYQSERDKVLEAATQLREENARLSLRLEMASSQNNQLLAKLGKPRERQ